MKSESGSVVYKWPLGMREAVVKIAARMKIFTLVQMLTQLTRTIPAASKYNTTSLLKMLMEEKKLFLKRSSLKYKHSKSSLGLRYYMWWDCSPEQVKE
jgi:hypothetical protein